jgi:lipopolysaccharide transport system permease protein
MAQEQQTVTAREHVPSSTVEPSGALVTVIRPTSGPVPPRLGELWRYREVFVFLVWRDVKVRYAQTALGAAWMVFQPLALMLVYTFAFSNLAHLPVTLGVPYPIFALSGLTLWIFISRGTFIGAESLLMNMPLVTKTACPRILLPVAAVVSVLADFVVTFALYLILAAFYGVLPGWHIVFVPPLLFVTFALVVGLSLWLSATSVRYRDVAQALPFLIQLWFFLSPVAYLLRTPGLSWQTIVQALNPAVGLLLAMRWALLGGPAPHGLLLASLIITTVIVVAGIARFARAERTIADDI